jgi:hypothetical protein
VNRKVSALIAGAILIVTSTASAKKVADGKSYADAPSVMRVTIKPSM